MTLNLTLEGEIAERVSRQFWRLLLTQKDGLNAYMGLYLTRFGLGVIVIDESGEVLDACTLFPLAQDFRWHDAITTLAKCIRRYCVTLVGIGSGIGFRYMQRLLAGFQARYPDMSIHVIPIDVTGIQPKASPEEGAISIARRLQHARRAATLFEMAKTKRQNKKRQELLTGNGAPFNTAMADALAKLKRDSS